MPRRNYTLLPDILVETADKIADSLAARGFSVAVEKLALGFPFPPTLYCKRGKLEQSVIEVVPSYDDARFSTWASYAKACPTEMKVFVAVSEEVVLSATALQKIRSAGIGIYRVQGGTVIPELDAADLSITISLPKLMSLPKTARPLLGPAYDHIAATRWREGFEDACKVLDVESRKYLKRWHKTGRVRFIANGKIINMTDRKIDKLTLGQLAVKFTEIQAQNSSDRMIGSALARINKDRVNLTHNKWKATTEKRLRANVGQHMWVIAQAMKELTK